MSREAYSNPYILKIQKKRLKYIAIDYLAVALLFFVLTIIVLIIALTNEDKSYASRILYIVIPILSGIIAIFLFFSIKRFLLLRDYKQARFYSEVAVNINCKGIRFITYAPVRGVADIVGIVFVDVNLQKYVYILPNKVFESKTICKNIRQKCVGNSVELVCYTGTKMVKRCDNLVVELKGIC